MSLEKQCLVRGKEKTTTLPRGKMPVCCRYVVMRSPTSFLPCPSLKGTARDSTSSVPRAPVVCLLPGRWVWRDVSPCMVCYRLQADGGTRISHHNRAKTAIVYITLRPLQKQGQNAIVHACGRVCRWWDTYITPQSCQDCYRVYYASSTAKTRTKRHCACVWTGLQMVGHVYHTTIVPRLLSCISRFVQCKNKDKAPLRMRVDGFADGGTHISNHNRADRAIVYITLHPRQKQGQNAIAHACGRVCRWWDTYITPQSCQDCYRVYHASSAAKTRAKRHCACVWTGLQMVGHIYQPTIVLRRTTFILGQKTRTNAIAHACGRVCRWWDTYIEPQSC